MDNNTNVSPKTKSQPSPALFSTAASQSCSPGVWDLWTFVDAEFLIRNLRVHGPAQVTLWNEIASSFLPNLLQVLPKSFLGHFLYPSLFQSLCLPLHPLGWGSGGTGMKVGRIPFTFRVPVHSSVWMMQWFLLVILCLLTVWIHVNLCALMALNHRLYVFCVNIFNWCF